MAVRNDSLKPPNVGRQDLAVWQRLPLLILGFASLLVGLLAGEIRAGWAISVPHPDLILLHGPLMVSGFLGTLIGLERAVAVARRPFYLGPAASVIGAVLLIVDAPTATAAIFFCVGAVGLLTATYVAYRRQPTLHTLTLLLGAGAWLVGNALWLGGARIPQLVQWWAVFLILTIAGERLELSRLIQITPLAQRAFAILVALMLVSLATLSWELPFARTAFALMLLSLTLWLIYHDIARRTIFSVGLTRFMAICMLSAYLWLIISAIMGLLSNDGIFAGTTYDATLHAVFLGFVFSMIFAHAPIILPAITSLTVRFSPFFYTHWGLLQLSLIMRVIALPIGWPAIYRLAAALNGIVIILFIVSTIFAVIRGQLSNIHSQN